MFSKQFYNPLVAQSGKGFEPQPLMEERRRLAEEARAYLHLFHEEHGTLAAFARQCRLVESELEQTGTYSHTYEELVYGARVAWRNTARCIGRLQWRSLHVRDLRHLRSAEEIFAALVEHMRLATNGGKIQPMISIFAPQTPGRRGIRIWNSQLIRYAGYRQHNDTVIGDPLQKELTEVLRFLGWHKSQGQQGLFDVLPLVIQMPDQPPRMFELPRDAILEVPLSHPEYDWFAHLGLKWHALPVISDMRLEIGGISYTAAPFNGYYMGTEIGARNLGDQQRYNLLPLIAECMGLNMRSDRTLWKDRALVELNVAVLHSFTQHGVTIVDHHTAARQFMHYAEKEKHEGRLLSADWGWIVPPLSGSTTPVFHTAYASLPLKPNFFAQTPPWLYNPDGAVSIL
ncbi:MAG: nitric oxide synthase oxygenase [Ktedonobacteraceae bacterium]